jgi:uncharacterized membrane protein
MTWNNEQEQNAYREYGGYTGSSHYQEQAYTQQQQQQAYQQPMQGARPIYEQPPFTVSSPYSDGRVAATFCYTFGWLSGLLFLLYGAQKPLVRFHALQSLIFFGGINLIDVGLIRMIIVTHHYWWYSMGMGSIWLLFFFLFMLLNFVAFVGWIVAMVQTAQGTYYKLPLVGNILARKSKLRTPPRW